jgi:hypothetical protein
MNPLGAKISSLMSAPSASNAFRSTPRNGGKQHGEVEEQRADRSVELLVVDDARLDAGDMGSGDGPDPPLPEERLGAQLRRRLETLLREGQPPTPKSASSYSLVR